MLRELKEEDQEALLALNNASTPAVNPLTLEELNNMEINNLINKIHIL